MMETIGCNGIAFYSVERHWYHVSSTLKKELEMLIPWDNFTGFNRTIDEPEGARICVAPTIEQCLTAIPYPLNAKFTIYQTLNMVLARQPYDVFDASITQEGWIEVPTEFIKIGTLSFIQIEKGLKISHVIEQAGAMDDVCYSDEVLKWWQGINLKRFIKNT